MNIKQVYLCFFTCVFFVIIDESTSCPDPNTVLNARTVCWVDLVHVRLSRVENRDARAVNHTSLCTRKYERKIGGETSPWIFSRPKWAAQYLQVSTKWGQHNIYKFQKTIQDVPKNATFQIQISALVQTTYIVLNFKAFIFI